MTFKSVEDVGGYAIYKVGIPLDDSFLPYLSSVRLQPNILLTPLPKEVMKSGTPINYIQGFWMHLGVLVSSIRVLFRDEHGLEVEKLDRVFQQAALSSKVVSSLNEIYGGSSFAYNPVNGSIDQEHNGSVILWNDDGTATINYDDRDDDSKQFASVVQCLLEYTQVIDTRGMIVGRFSRVINSK